MSGDPTRELNSAPTLREVAMVLFRQWRVFLWVSGLVLVAAIIYVIAGARYQAHMTVMVRPGRADAPMSAQENAPIDLTHLAITEEELNSEVELLRDDEVLRKVAGETGLGGRDWFFFLHVGEGRAERVERAARRLAKKLDVEPIKKSNLITVSYRSDDPARAEKVLQSVEQAYLAKHSSIHRPGGQVQFFEHQTMESRHALDEAKDNLLQFAAGHAVIAAAQQRDLTLQKLSDLDAGYRQTRIELAETQQRVRDLQERLNTLPERTTTQIRTADNPDLLKALKSNLLELQLKRIQLLTKFDPSHRLVQEVEQEIAHAQNAIAAETLAHKSTHYEWAKSELERAQVQMKGLEARAAAIATEETACRAEARRLGEAAIHQDDLQNSERAAEDNYLLYAKKQEEARMADALDQR